MVKPDATRRDAVGAARLGTAGSHSFSAIGTLQPNPQPPPTDWVGAMMTQVRRWLPERAIVVVADSSFAALELLDATTGLPVPVHLVTRRRLDAALYQSAPPRQPQQMGHPRQVGKRLPTLTTLVDDPATVWQQVTMQRWYGGRDYSVDLLSETAVWYHTGLPPVPIRWVLVKDLQGRFEPQAFLCTDLTVAPEQILHWLRQRWQVEVTFGPLTNLAPS